MPDYEIDFSYTTRIGDTVILQAADADFAEVAALNYIHETYADVENVELDGLRQITERVTL